jgi:hypothetical protein
MASRLFLILSIIVVAIVVALTAYKIGKLGSSNIPDNVIDVNAFLRQPQIINCRAAARPVGSEGALGVCIREDHDIGLPYVETLIYDSSDEITRDPSQRSNDWNKAACSLASQAPFGIIGFKDIKAVLGHYYKVAFDAQLQPEPQIFESRCKYISPNAQ